MEKKNAMLQILAKIGCVCYVVAIGWTSPFLRTPPPLQLKRGSCYRPTFNPISGSVGKYGVVSGRSAFRCWARVRRSYLELVASYSLRLE